MTFHLATRLYLFFDEVMDYTFFCETTPFLSSWRIFSQTSKQSICLFLVTSGLFSRMVHFFSSIEKNRHAFFLQLSAFFLKGFSLFFSQSETELRLFFCDVIQLGYILLNLLSQAACRRKKTKIAEHYSVLRPTLLMLRSLLEVAIALFYKTHF